jgi:hypothetical protein
LSWNNIWEAGIDWVIGEKYPGQFGAGLWHQTGVLQRPNGASQNGTGGFYMFGGQRIWCNSHNRASPDGVSIREGKSKVVVSALHDRQYASISMFFQFG